MKTERLLWTILGVFLIAVGIYSLNRWLRGEELRKPTTQMPDYGIAPSFSLTDENNRSFSDASLKGHIWLTDFIFTQCAGTCPMMTAKLATIEKSLEKTPDVHLVSISVDPKHDTPEALRLYAKNYGADTAQWSFLTGDRSLIYTVAKNGFHLPVDSIGGDKSNPIVHSERIVLIDQSGHMRAFFDAEDADLQAKILTAIGDLMRETKNS